MHNHPVLAIVRTFVIAVGVMACSIQAHADSANDLLMPGQVIQGHMKYESECSNCHKPYDKAAQSGLCKDCHKDIGKDIAEKHGFQKEQRPGLSRKTG